MLPPGKFNDMIPEALLVYAGSFVTITATIFRKRQSYKHLNRVNSGNREQYLTGYYRGEVKRETFPMTS